MYTVNQTTFHPTAPHILFLRTRGILQPIRAYDLRYMNTTPSFLSPPSDSALIALLRQRKHEDEKRQQHNTSQKYQQRLCFDIHWTGQWLISGDHQGNVSVWSLVQEDEAAGVEVAKEQEKRVREPKSQWNLSNGKTSEPSRKSSGHLLTFSAWHFRHYRINQRPSVSSIPSDSQWFSLMA